jgi:hypothetical protein
LLSLIRNARFSGCPDGKPELFECLKVMIYKGIARLLYMQVKFLFC